MVKVGDFLTQNKIFQQRRATATGTQRILVIGNTDALVGCQREVFAAFTLLIKRF